MSPTSLGVLAESVNPRPYGARIADHFIQGKRGFESQPIVKKPYLTSFAVVIVVTHIVYSAKNLPSIRNRS
jgi:hypothetical protein